MRDPALEEQVEARLVDLTYTVVGLGVLAFRYSEPHRKRLETELQSLFTPKR